MAIIIDTTVGGASSNSYVTLAEVAEYAVAAFDAAAWTVVPDTATKNIYIVRAARLLDAMVTFVGERVAREQKREWPRYYVYHPARGYYEGTEIPQAIKDAQCELAIYLASQSGATENVFAAAGTENFDSISVGPITLDFRDGTVIAEGVGFYINVVRPILRAGNCISAAGRLTR